YLSAAITLHKGTNVLRGIINDWGESMNRFARWPWHGVRVAQLTAFICATGLVVAGVPSAARAAGVVGTGTAVSCTEAALNTALAGGGLVTFSCGVGAVTITVSSTKNLTADTTVDGGG